MEQYYLDFIYKIEQSRFSWQENSLHLHVKKLLSKNASLNAVKMYASIVRAESLLVQNLYVGDNKHNCLLNVAGIISLSKGIIPKPPTSDEGSLRFALGTLEPAIKMKPYTDSPAGGLEYSFLFAQAAVVSSHIQVILGDTKKAYTILKDLELDINLDKSNKCVGGQILMALGLYIRGLCLLYENELSAARNDLEKCIDTLHIFINRANSNVADDKILRAEDLSCSTSFFTTLVDAQLVLNYINLIQSVPRLDTFDITFKSIFSMDRKRNDGKWKLLMFKKAMLIRSYLHTFLDIDIRTFNPLGGIVQVTRVQESKYESEFIGFVLCALEQYERYSIALYPHPIANRTDEEEFMYSLVLDCYNIYAHVLSLPLPGEDVHASVARYRKLMDVFYRGTGHTICHLPLSRIFVNSVSAACHLDVDLVSQQEIQEAIRVANMYLCIWSEEFCTIADKLGKTSLELEISKGGKEAGMRRYSAMSHRRVSSKVDSSLFNVSAYAKDVMQRMGAISENENERDTHGSEGDYSASCMSCSSSDSENFYIMLQDMSLKSEAILKLRSYVVDKVGTERHEDIIGVLIAAANIILLNHCGPSEEIAKAIHFSECALVIYESQMSRVGRKGNAHVEFHVCKTLGLSYGEYALEVNDVKKREYCQKLAVNVLQRAVVLKSDCWSTKFQLSLQLSESGKIASAIEVLKSCLSLSPPTPTPWNLMAILLSISRDFEKAMYSCDLGIRECLKICAKTKSEQASISSHQSARSEESVASNKYANVDCVTREEIFCTILTKFALEIPGITSGTLILERLEDIFTAFRELFGANLSICGSNSSSDISRKVAQSKNSIIATENDYTVPLSVRPKILMYYIHIWIISSMIYRYLGYYDEAWNSVNSAKKILIDLEELASHGSSEAEAILFNTSGQLVRNISTSSNNQSNSTSFRRSTGQCKVGQSSIASKIARHLFADISFESCLIKCSSSIAPVESVLISQLSSTHISQSSRRAYSNPHDDALRDSLLSWMNDLVIHDQERFSAENRYSRRSSYDLIRSFSESSVTMSARIKSLSAKPVGKRDAQPSSSQDKKEKKDDIFSAPKVSPANGDAANLFTQPNDDSSVIDEVIGKLHEVILFNRYHIGAHVMLGVLYYIRGKYDIASRYLLQVCNTEKGRGSEFGRNGVTSFAGGISGRWQQISWRFLSKCLLKKGNIEVSKIAAIRALRERQASRIRCMESLRRVS